MELIIEIVAYFIIGSIVVWLMTNEDERYMLVLLLIINAIIVYGIKSYI